MEVNMKESGLEKPIDINIRIVRNGVTLSGSLEDKRVEYVYTSLKKALSEVPGIVSVLKQDEKKITKDELDEEEERINNSQEKEE